MITNYMKILFLFLEEMKNFAHQWTDPFFQFPWLILGIALHLCLITGSVVMVSSSSLLSAIITTLSLLACVFFFLILVYYCSHRFVLSLFLHSFNYFTQVFNFTGLIGLITVLAT